MEQTKDTKRTALIRRFHALLGQLQDGEACKEHLLSSYGVLHTSDLSLEQLQESCSLLSQAVGDQMTEKQQKHCSLQRRAFASCARYCQLIGYKATPDKIRGMLARSAKCKDFYSMTDSRLLGMAKYFEGQISTMQEMQALTESLLQEIRDQKNDTESNA